MQRRAFLAATGAALAGTAGCLAGATGGLSEGDYDIGMSSAAFLPAEFEVEVGETVVWANTSSRAHTVTAVSMPEGADYFATGGFENQDAAVNGWQSRLEGGIPTGGTYEHTFDVPGEYDYYCIPHAASGMDGKIVVSE